MWSLKIVYLIEGPQPSISLEITYGPHSGHDSPFLELNLTGIRASLGTDEFLQVADGVFRAALNPDY